MKHNTCIEAAVAADIEAMTGLLGELFALESDFRPEPDKQRRGLRLILEQPALGQLFVLRRDGQVIGMASALLTVSTAEGRQVVLLEDVIVQAALRGQQLGRLLIEHVLGWAQARGVTRVTLLADQDNAGALAFYRKLGFAPSAMCVWRKTLSPE
jgi:GNAT superfamily N-acetyltransferase